MKKAPHFISLILLIFFFISCSSKDDSENNTQTVNITYSVTTTRNTDAIIKTTIDNDTETNTNPALPFSFTLAQEEVSSGSYLKLTFLENGIYVVGTGGVSSWTDYEANLSISVDGEVIKTQNFQVTENSGLIQIDYTF